MPSVMWTIFRDDYAICNWYKRIAMETIFVGVSGINAVDNPGPGIAVARSLKEDRDLDIRIVGLAYDAMEPGIYMDWVIDKSFIVPYPSAGGGPFVKRLLEIKETYGLDHVIPNLDAELPLYIKYAEQLRSHGITSVLPNQAQFRLRGKDKLTELAGQIGIRLPKTEVVNSYPMLAEAIEKIGLPVMVKGCFYKAYRAYTIQEATGYFNKLVAEWGYPVIVQEVVAGDELNVVGLGDGKGNSLGLVAIKKIWVTSLGKIWTGVTIQNEQMLAAAANFVKISNWRGPFELECIVSGGETYLIEINPRFPAWVYIATGVGLNLPSQLLRSGRNLPVNRLNGYPAGKLFVRYSYDLVTDMTAFQNAMHRGENP
jgi:carbamoyl-phosphate synthase large subunit